ncbi:tetratricopeptide repeat protein [Flammeovirgaceae bacterium SG7u.111]|nr:tetratricopeptide repeat protein [Flammeovirgaceae bacterium SG7u.132]WPO37391.1 tetratricopeptide repeat protein [Flammeovirgaceae bacterium SG7u.111]
MKEARIKKLQEFLKEDPNDPFLIYALAGEYLEKDPQKAIKQYEFLLEKHEDYFATYYHAANLYALLGDNTKAEETYKKGMEICQKLGEHHAYSELQSAYNNFLFDTDDL